jgi:hypothetical protein
MHVVPLTLPAGAVAISCSAEDELGFAGMLEPDPVVLGAQAYLEFFNEALCSGSGEPAFSSYWIAVIHMPSPTGLNIFQVGVDKCRDGNDPIYEDACGDFEPPQNTPYYFWAYGREEGPCGSALLPQAHLAPKGLAGPGSPNFKVEKQPDLQNPNTMRYHAIIDGSVQRAQTVHSIETCWGGANYGEYMNEVLNAKTQSGGTVANHQGFTNVRYKDTQYWRPVARNQSAPCDTYAMGWQFPSTQKCNVSSSQEDDWYSWDTRF